MAPSHALAEECEKNYALTRALRRTYIEQGDFVVGDATLADCFKKLEAAALQLREVARYMSPQLADPCRPALYALTKDFAEDVAQYQALPRSRTPWEHGSRVEREVEGPSSRSLQGDRPLARERRSAGTRQIWVAYTYSFSHITAAIKQEYLPSGHSGGVPLRYSTSVDAHCQATVLLHGLLGPVGVPRPPSTVNSSRPPTARPSVESGNRSYERHQALLQRFEQAYDNTVRNSPMPEDKKVVWDQRLIVYWSAQTLDLLGLVGNIGTNDESVRFDAPVRDRVHRFLLAALKTLWLAHINFSGSMLGVRPLREVIIARCVTETCTKVYDFFNTHTQGWMKEQLAHVEISESEFRIPRVSDLLQFTRESGPDTNASRSSNQRPNAALPSGFRSDTALHVHARSSSPRPHVWDPSFVHLDQIDRSVADPHNLLHDTQGLAYFNHGAVAPGDNPLDGGVLDKGNRDALSLRGRFGAIRHHTPTNSSEYDLDTQGSSSSGSAPVRARTTVDEIQTAKGGTHCPVSEVFESFETDLETYDIERYAADKWLVSETRIYREMSIDVASLRLQTSRISSDGRSHIQHESLHALSNTEMVPRYAFQAFENTEHHVFLRCGGTQSGLSFRFRGHEALNHVVNFQSALLGATCEAAYPVAEIRLKRSDSDNVSRPVACMQLWTDDHSWRRSGSTRPGTTKARTPVQMSSRRQHRVPFQDSFDDFEGSKLVIFAQGSIFVILITNEFVCGKDSAPNTWKLSPNKQIASCVRVRELQGSSTVPAGVPLNQAGLGFEDVHGPHFQPYKSVKIQLNGGDAASTAFKTDLDEKMHVWSKRPSKQREFREKERNSRIQTVSPRIRRKDSEQG